MREGAVWLVNRTRLVTTLRRIAWLAGVIGLTACPQRTAVWIEQGSTASHVIFGIADTRHGSGRVSIGVVRVYGCEAPDGGQGAMWVVSPKNGTANVHQLVYGETPPGFVSDQGPRPLAPGCYRVAISGTGRTQFTIDATGAVTEQEIPD